MLDRLKEGSTFGADEGSNGVPIHTEDKPNSVLVTDQQIATAYPLAAPYVRALRDRRRDQRWTMPSGEVVSDPDPLLEDFLPPAEALRMRELVDPLKAPTTRAGNDVR